ncbi:hypothetical protein D3C81_1028850 [compost metagenome]
MLRPAVNQRGVTIVELPVVGNIVLGNAIVPVDRPGHQPFDGMAGSVETLECIYNCSRIDHIASGRSVIIGR